VTVWPLKIKCQTGLRIRQRDCTAERDRVEVRRSTTIDGLEQCGISASDDCAVVVVRQPFGVAAEFVWVKGFVLIR
jgi:GH43 family beta-xylosidase